MSSVVSIGDAPEQNWMVQNAIYAWFVGLAASRCRDEALASRLVMSEYTNGISLQDILEEDPSVARRLALLLRAVAADVAAGKHRLTDEQGRHRAEMENATREAFSCLVRMLDAFEPI